MDIDYNKEALLRMLAMRELATINMEPNSSTILQPTETLVNFIDKDGFDYSPEEWQDPDTWNFLRSYYATGIEEMFEEWQN